jgi:hypothetical protein
MDKKAREAQATDPVGHTPTAKCDCTTCKRKLTGSNLLLQNSRESWSGSAYMADAYQTSMACVHGMTRRGACLVLDSR